MSDIIPVSEVHSLAPSQLIVLYEIDTRPFEGNAEGQVIRFHNGLGPTGQPVVWNGNQYQPMGIVIEGMEMKTSGQLPRPQLRISNISGIMTGLTLDTNDLVGAKVRRIRVFAKHIDAVNFGQGNNLLQPFDKAMSALVEEEDVVVLADGTEQGEVRFEKSPASAKVEAGTDLAPAGVTIPTLSLGSSSDPSPAAIREILLGGSSSTEPLIVNGTDAYRVSALVKIVNAAGVEDVHLGVPDALTSSADHRAVRALPASISGLGVGGDLENHWLLFVGYVLGSGASERAVYATGGVWDAVTLEKLAGANNIVRLSAGATQVPLVVGQEMSNIAAQWETVVRVGKIRVEKLDGSEPLQSELVASRLMAENGPGNPTADPRVKYPDDVYMVVQKRSENRSIVEFELGTPMDVFDIKLPRRRVLSAHCVWRYRGEECGYDGPAVADSFDNATADLSQDQCGKRVVSCKLRFDPSAQNEPLPFGGFPGVRQ